MHSRLLPTLCAVLSLLPVTGCHSDAEKQSEAVTGHASQTFHVTDYGTSDPALEPTLRLGGKVELRTASGAPVVIRSQEAEQRRAAQAQRDANAENVAK